MQEFTVFFIYTYSIQFILCSLISIYSLTLTDNINKNGRGEFNYDDYVGVSFIPFVGIFFLVTPLANLIWAIKNKFTKTNKNIFNYKGNKNATKSTSDYNLKNQTLEICNMFYPSNMRYIDDNNTLSDIYNNLPTNDTLQLEWAMRLYFNDNSTDKVKSLFENLIGTLHGIIDMFDSRSEITNEMLEKMIKIVSTYNNKMSSMITEEKERVKLEKERKLKEKQSIVNSKLDELVETTKIIEEID